MVHREGEVEHDYDTYKQKDFKDTDYIYVTWNAVNNFD